MASAFPIKKISFAVDTKAAFLNIPTLKRVFRKCVVSVKTPPSGMRKAELTKYFRVFTESNPCPNEA